MRRLLRKRCLILLLPCHYLENIKITIYKVKYYYLRLKRLFHYFFYPSSQYKKPSEYRDIRLALFSR